MATKKNAKKQAIKKATRPPSTTRRLFPARPPSDKPSTKTGKAKKKN